MKIYNFLIPLLIFTFGLVNCGRDLFGTGLERYPGDLADTRFNNVILEHDYQWLIGQQESLWDPSFFYPAKNMLAGSDNHLGTFLLYVPFRLVGFDEIRSFQWWVLCLFILNFFVFYKVARKLGLNVAASSAGAFLFTFSMPVLGSVHHIQTMCKFSFPLVIFFFYRILFDTKKQNILYFALSLTHVFYCSLYYGMFTILILAVFFIGSLFFKPKLKAFFARENLLWLVSSVVVMAGLIIPLLLKYVEMEKFSPDLIYDHVEGNVPHPYSFLLPHPGTQFYGFLFEQAKIHTNSFWQHCFFIGFTSMALIFSSVYFLRKYREGNTVFVICCITLFGVILLTSAAGKFSFYRYIIEIRGFGHLRVVNRIVLLELFFMSLLVAWMVNRIKTNAIQTKMLLASLVIFICGEHFMQKDTLKFDLVEKAKHNHAYVNKAIDKCRTKPTVFVVLKDSSLSRNDFNEGVAQIDGMMSSLQKGVPTINGYSTAYDPRFWNIVSNDVKGVNIWLNAYGVDTNKFHKKILVIRCKQTYENW
ncbi:MAG TPA: hypothetical protein VK177_20185 [Flavobacteriales bacterium]|nr:hypothetical protein [Flavobacteriales bacterium]